MAPRATEQDGISDMILYTYDGSEEEGDNDSALARRTTLEEAIAPQNFVPEEATPSTMPSPHGPTAMRQYSHYVPQYLMTRMRSPLLVRINKFSVARYFARYLTKTDSPPMPQRPDLHAILWDHRIDRSSRSTANDTDDESNISSDQ